MRTLSIGDLAQGFQTRLSTARMKADLERLSQELTTGQVSDVGRVLGGDFSAFAGIERSLSRIAVYDATISELASVLDAKQLALEQVGVLGDELVPAVLESATSANPVLMRNTAEDAKQKFFSTVSTLNTRVSGRSLFAGAATDSAALASGEDILAELVTATAGLTTAGDIEAAVTAWFDDPGGGFETMGYLGSDADAGPVPISVDETISLSLRADDSGLRGLLQAQALAALVAEDVLPSLPEEQAALMEAAGTRLLEAQSNLVTLRARVGALEGRVEATTARHAAETAGYELAKAKLVAADPYDTAVTLEEIYARLETLYTVTARISALRFTDYMR